MSAGTRLWRRAPVWRVCLISAIAFSGLAAMFPPHWLAMPNTKMTTPRFTPLPSATPSDNGRLEILRSDARRSGVIPFSGKKLPLPEGSWRELAMAQQGGAAAVQVLLLVRVEDQHLTGLEMAASPDPLNSSVGGFGGYGPCNATDAIARQSVPLPGANPLARECWALSDIDMNATDSPILSDEVVHRSLARLQELGVAVPDHMQTLSFLRSGEAGWELVFLFLPARREEATRRLVTWVRRFTPLLHKGYDSTLTPAELAALPHDPS